ncbi:MAG TPA: hypothetical protein VM263_00430 [Acidimicrobiales bacterium]|nr:hypothetical protein [Acidimicrobiales bacterium]
MGARRALAAALLPAALAAGACSDAATGMPDCPSPRRLAIVAQAVPSAAYLPCIAERRQGWTVGALDVERDSARFSLRSDRADGRRVDVELRAACDDAGAVPTTPRADGVRTGLALDSISPRFAGTLVDAFAGGCVTYRFDFPRGPHIALMEDLQAIVGLVTRRELRLDLRRELGVDIGP